MEQNIALPVLIAVAATAVTLGPVCIVLGGWLSYKLSAKVQSAFLAAMAELKK
jgi:hypothetical protein